ncbi:MAG: circularly permuted type 2 ATP-grasp protein, partial [Caldilineaceae bacterium]|nr:circularly permuted type 2 ATP-grasp protein [Caldilineaceae bacterium]
YNETYFEHAYLAAYLGYALVQGDDLTVVNGGVALKALSGLQPVDVILRRVDDTFCDPLELREDSWLGVAGLVEAARRQAVAIVNPLGSGILENPGMIPFLPGLARYFLGEDLLLPSAATWWCGQPNELDHVLNHLDTLVIRRIARQGQSTTLFGERLSKSERAALRARIQTEPHQYVGQEQVSFSTAPAFVNHHCEPRHTVVRTFSVADGNGYQVMPGGLARAAPAAGELFVSNSAGGISKDLWVLTQEAQPYTSLWRQVGQREQVLHSTQFLSSRSAENLFWVGRYAERAEFTARLLRTIFDYFGEDEVGESFVAGPLVGETMGASAGEITCLHQLLRSLTQVTMTYPGFVDEEGAALLA